MTRILVRPDQLRSLSTRLQRAAGDLQGVEGRVSSALGGLAWEARQKAGVDGQVNRACSQARTLASQTEELARYLQRKAQAFEEADGQGVSGVGQVFGAFTEWVQSAPSWWGFPSQQANAFSNMLGSSQVQALHLPVSGGAAVVGLASLTYLSEAFSQITHNLGERIWNWLHGKGWKTGREASKWKSEVETDRTEPKQSDAQLPEQKQEQLRRWTLEEIKTKVRNEHGKLPGKEQCVAWVQSRRKDLHGTPLPAISIYNKENWGAYNYIKIFNAKQIDESNVATMKPGTALVWNPGQRPGPADATYGHVAIFEGFAEDGVWISNANMGDPIRKLTWDEVKGLYMIPPDAKPVEIKDFKL